MRIAIVQFPGSNCERETRLAVLRAGMEPIEFLWNESKEKLSLMDGFIIVGGFSYEDRSRAGIIAALDPVMNTIREQSEVGKPILGICNGAQILVETGLVPGLNGYQKQVVLTNNKRIKNGRLLGTGYYNAWVNLKPGNRAHNAFTHGLNPESILTIPIAHGEGRFLASETLLQQMEEAGLVTFQYCDEEGRVVDEFPTNPNGSMHNIAAISNSAGNILAIMPHPERTPAGDVIFHSMREYLNKGLNLVPAQEARHCESTGIKPFQPHPQSYEMKVDLIIADNHAFTVQNTLKHLGIKAQVKRQTHWEICCRSQSVFHQIQASGSLYNEQKERLVPTSKKTEQRSFLVRAKEDWLGLKKIQYLRSHVGIEGIDAIHHGVLWHISAESNLLDAAVEKIINTSILFNPLSHECYEYV